MLLKLIQNTNRRTSFDFLSSVRKYFSTSSQSAVDLASKDGEMRIFLVAGEASGDAIGSRLITALKKLSPFPIRLAGVGGSKAVAYLLDACHRLCNHEHSLQTL